jgi:branched-chain amino acid transport system substrate-binding protein
MQANQRWEFAVMRRRVQSGAMRIAALAVLAALLAVVASGCAGGDQGGDTIRIGMTSPLTGPAAEAGVALRQGAELAVEEINAAGGLAVGNKKYKVQYFVEDTQAKPEVGVAAAEKLITKEKVHYLIGDAFSSSVTMAIMELAPKYKIPIVSAEPVSEAIADKVKNDPEKYAYYWKGDFGATAYGATVFNTIKWLLDKEQLKANTKKVFYIVEDTDYGRSNATAASALFKGIGWSDAATETVPLGHTDFYPQLNKLRDSKADVLITCFTSLSSGVALVKQFQELGVGAAHISIYYATRPEFIAQAGPAAEGLLWTPLIFDPEQVASQKPFADKIQGKFKASPTSDHAYGYDSINIALDSIKRGGSLQPADIIKAVAALDYKGMIGRYVFDQTNHQVKAGPEFIPVPAAQIQSGKNLIVWPEANATAKYKPQSWVK